MHGSTSPSKNAWSSCSHRQFAATSADRLAGSRTRRIQAEVVQQHQRGQRRGPRLPVGEVRLDAGPPVVDDAPREARAAVPLAVGIAQGEQASSPALGLDPGALGRDLVGGRVDEVAQHLPPDRGVTVEEPVDDVHGCDRRFRAHPGPAHRLGATPRSHSLRVMQDCAGSAGIGSEGSPNERSRKGGNDDGVDERDTGPRPAGEHDRGLAGGVEPGRGDADAGPHRGVGGGRRLHVRRTC